MAAAVKATAVEASSISKAILFFYPMNFSPSLTLNN